MTDNDEDDDSFGEFTFAPIQSTPNPSSHVPITTTANDDGWGDFNQFQNNPTDQNVKSPPTQTQVEPKWEKFKGALPLSLFGDEEDVDEKMDMFGVGDDVKQFVLNNNNDKKNYGGGAKLGINDLIANLYSERQQKQEEEEEEEETVKAGDSGDKLDKLEFGDINTVSGGVREQESEDEGGWEFVDASSESKIANGEKDHKELSEKTVASAGLQGDSHGATDLFASVNNGFVVESHVTNGGFDSEPVTNFYNGFSDLKVDSKGTTNVLSSSPLGGGDDFDDTFGEFEAAFIDHASGKKELSEERFDPLGSHGTSDRSADLFSFSNGVSGGSHTESNGFDFNQIQVVENGFASDPFSQTEWKETKDDSDLQFPDVGADDESFGKFEATSQESGLKPQGFEASTKNYKEPVPLSIFGIEEDPEADNSLNLEHELFKSSTHGKHTRNLSSNLSINDILSDLYSQANPISSDGTEDLLHSTGNEYGSHLVEDKNNENDNNNDNDDDDFIDGSWEFKDASFQSTTENHNSFKKKLNSCIDLYSNLKDDLCVVAMHMDNHTERVISLDKYIETYQEPEYRLLESEYNISRRLLLAESDLPTAVDLINHFTSVLKILTLAPKCEPNDYVSLWLKVISVCSQELNHGTWIWKQSLEKNVHSEILSDKQGRQFIISLGEIYRVVMILEAAVKFYKPWILLSGADLEGFSSLVEECRLAWSTSRLEESIPADYLLESIRHIQNLDKTEIADQILSQEESQCVLSLLSSGVVPEMKMVIWNEDKYFVTLANLWANLISPNPPKMSIHAG